MKDYTDIIYSPVITEKSAIKMQNENVYTFKVKSRTLSPAKFLTLIFIASPF